MDETETNAPTDTGKPDWLAYQRFFETVGGVEGYLELRRQDRAMLDKLLEAFHIDLKGASDETT